MCTLSIECVSNPSRMPDNAKKCESIDEMQEYVIELLQKIDRLQKEKDQLNYIINGR